MEFVVMQPELGVLPDVAEPANREPMNRHVCLITALTVADFIDPDLTVGALTDTGAQLGVFTLAAILRQEGFVPHVVNLDQLFIDYLRQSPTKSAPTEEESETEIFNLDGIPYFFSYVAERLRDLEPGRFDVFGLSSICSSYPLTVRLAEEVKRLNPKATVILGGPQASVVDTATMRTVCSVDLVVRGEADKALPAVLKILANGEPDKQLAAIPGITFRRGGEVVRNPNGPVIEDLDLLPMPAYDLDPGLRNRGGVHLEIGRGCPFACTFCSTNDFFRRNFRLKSPGRMIAEMKQVQDTYGHSYFSLVHDMYTVDHKRVEAFCAALEESGNGFTWGCSARTDCIDDNLIALMAHAGCRGIFFGIETGSARLQRVIKKNLDLGEAWERIESASRHGISTAVALITGFPDETRDDLRDTIHFFVEALRFDNAEPQLSLLAPLAATPIYEEYRDRLVYDQIFSDMSHQGWRQDPADIELIRTWPELFPNFYAVPTKWLDRQYFKQVRDFVTYVASWFRWLPVALLHDSGDFLNVFDRWRVWLNEKQSEHSAAGPCGVPYYTHRRFRKDFLEFVRTCYLADGAAARPALTALLAAEGPDFPAVSKLEAPAPGQVPDASEFDSDCFPYLAEGLHTLILDVDYKELIASLRNKSGLAGVPQRKSTVVYRPVAGKRVQIWQLAPECAAILRLCDGHRRGRQIVREFSRGFSALDGIPAEKVAWFAVSMLRDEGFLAFSRQPLAIRSAEPSETRPQFRWSPPPELSSTQRPWPTGAESDR